MTDKIVLPETRCPFCHENVIAGKDDQHGCQKCRAWHHTQCWIEHGGCSTCGFHDQEAEDIRKAKDRIESITIGTEAFVAKQKRDPGKWCGELPEECYKLVADEIKNSPEFEEVYSIVKSNAKGKIYLVGGKVYRTLASILHMHFNRGDDYKPDAHKELKCDWDFLVDGFKTKRVDAIPERWCYTSQTAYDGTVLHNPYRIHHDAGLVRWNKKELRRDNDWNNLGLPEDEKSEQDEVLCKIDMMNINKVRYIKQNNERPSWYQFWKKDPPPPTLDDYFNAVPMDIQAIAFDPETETLICPTVCATALLKQEVGINNILAIEKLATRENLGISDIVRKKAKTLPGYSFNSKPDPMLLARLEFKKSNGGKSPLRRCRNSKHTERWDARLQTGCPECQKQADAKKAWEKELDPHDV